MAALIHFDSAPLGRFCQGTFANIEFTLLRYKYRHVDRRLSGGSLPQTIARRDSRSGVNYQALLSQFVSCDIHFSLECGILRLRLIPRLCCAVPLVS